jgi:hypothetical protein
MAEFEGYQQTQCSSMLQGWRLRGGTRSRENRQRKREGQRGDWEGRRGEEATGAERGRGIEGGRKEGRREEERERGGGERARVTEGRERVDQRTLKRINAADRKRSYQKVGKAGESNK